MAEPQFNYLKFKDVVHYVCAACPADRLGSVKLHKVLYYADMVPYATHGTPLTGAVFRRQPRGPMAQKLPRALRELQSEGAIEISEQDYFGYRKAVYRSVCEPDLHRISKAEKAWLDEAIDFVCHDHSARTISELSHTLAWESVEMGEVMPYRSAILMFSADVSDVDADWAEREADRIEAGKIKPLDTSGDGRFQSRLREARRRQPVTA